GIDGDLLLVDEFQDIASGRLPVLEETLSHSPLRRVVLTGASDTRSSSPTGKPSHSVRRQGSWVSFSISDPKETDHESLVVGVAGLVVGAVGTRLVHHPEQVAHELHEAAAFASGEAPRGLSSKPAEGRWPSQGPEREA